MIPERFLLLDLYPAFPVTVDSVSVFSGWDKNNLVICELSSYVCGGLVCIVFPSLAVRRIETS